MYVSETGDYFFKTLVSSFFEAFSHVMKGVNGFRNEGYTIMTLMRMTFGEFDVSCNAVAAECTFLFNFMTMYRINHLHSRQYTIASH